MNNEEMICEAPTVKYSTESGWICPKCGASVSPKERTCPSCSGDTTVTYDLGKPYVTCTSDYNGRNGRDNEQLICS